MPRKTYYALTNRLRQHLKYTPGEILGPTEIRISQEFDTPERASTTAGIQEAIDDLPAAGGIVFVPAGTHTISERIELAGSDGGRRRVVLMGAGPESIIRLADGTVVASLIRMHDDALNTDPIYNQLRDLYIDGNLPSNTGNGHVGIDTYYCHDCKIVNVEVSGADDHAIWVQRTRNVMILDCHVHNCNGIGIYSNGVTDPTLPKNLIVRNCTIHHMQDNGIELHNAEWALIDGCVVYGETFYGNSLLTANANAAQFDCTVADATGFTVGQEVHIRDDVANETNQIANIVGLVLTMENALTNTYTVAQNGFVATACRQGVGISFVDSEHGTIRGCHVYHNGEDGIYTSPFTRVDNCVVHDNSIGIGHWGAHNGIDMAEGTTVIGCEIYGNGDMMSMSYGVRNIAATGHRCRILNNRFGESSRYHAIRLFSNTEGHQVIGNHLGDTCYISMIQVEHCLISGNISTDAGDYAIAVNGNHLIITDNIAISSGILLDACEFSVVNSNSLKDGVRGVRLDNACKDCIVSNNIIDNMTVRAIEIDATSEDNVVRGNHMKNGNTSILDSGTNNLISHNYRV